MRLKKALEDKSYDLRLREKHIAQGRIEKKDVEQLLASLPDDSANMTTTDQANKSGKPVEEDQSSGAQPLH